MISPLSCFAASTDWYVRLGYKVPVVFMMVTSPAIALIHDVDGVVPEIPAVRTDDLFPVWLAAAVCAREKEVGVSTGFDEGLSIGGVETWGGCTGNDALGVWGKLFVVFIHEVRLVAEPWSGG